MEKKRLEIEYKNMKEMCEMLKNEKNRLQTEYDNLRRSTLDMQSGTGIVSSPSSRLTRSPTMDEQHESKNSIKS